MAKYTLLERIIKGSEFGKKRREFLTELRKNEVDPREINKHPESSYYEKSIKLAKEVYSMGPVKLIGFIFDKWLNYEEERKNAVYLKKWYSKQ